MIIKIGKRTLRLHAFSLAVGILIGAMPLVPRTAQADEGKKKIIIIVGPVTRSPSPHGHVTHDDR